MRRELGRKPDLDPGPRVNQIDIANPDYQQTIRDAHNSLNQFRRMLPADRSPRSNAMVKTVIVQGDNTAFIWLNNVRDHGAGFTAEFYEVPNDLEEYARGDEVEVADTELLDWMVNEDGLLHGGFSIRYVRARLPVEERAEYDKYIGVRQYV